MWSSNTRSAGGGAPSGWVWCRPSRTASRSPGNTLPTRLSPPAPTLPPPVLQPLEMGDAGYKTLDLKQIYMFESTPNVLMVRNDSPFKTLKDFVEYAKKNPPGVVTVGGSGTSSANDLGTTMLGKAAGITLTYVPFGGTGSAVPALLGNHV